MAALNRSLTSFYRGVTADTKALAEALPALPETADELRAIAKILGAESEDIKLGEAASVTTVKKEPLDNYRVVYFATHALVAGEVEKFAKVKAEPALVLSIPEKPTEEDDGFLRASEVAMLKLNADFVVLSACNTAAGDKPGAEALSVWRVRSSMRERNRLSFRIGKSIARRQLRSWTDYLKRLKQILIFRTPRRYGFNVADDRQFFEARMGSADVLGAVRRRW